MGTGPVWQLDLGAAAPLLAIARPAVAKPVPAGVPAGAPAVLPASAPASAPAVMDTVMDAVPAPE